MILTTRKVTKIRPRFTSTALIDPLDNKIETPIEIKLVKSAVKSKGAKAPKPANIS